MEGGRRSGEASDYVVKNKSSKGCLIVRKKAGEGVGRVGSSGAHKVFDPKHEKKRLRMNLSDSGSSDELLMQPRRRVGPETMRVRNGLSGYEKGIEEESDVRRKRVRGEKIRRNEVGAIGRNGEDVVGRKRNKLGVFEFDEYEGNDRGVMRRRRPEDDDDDEEEDGGMNRSRYFGSMVAGRNGIQREYETGSSRHAVTDGRKSLYSERGSGLGRGGHGEMDAARLSMPFLRDKYDSDEPIRVQGKNGVLKVMVNKKKKVGRSFNGFDRLEAEDRKGLRMQDSVKKNSMIRPPFYSNSKSCEKPSSFSRKEKSPMNLLRPHSAKNGKISDGDSENSDTLLKLGPKSAEAHKSEKILLPTKKSKDDDMDSDDSDTSLKLGHKNVDILKPMKGVSSGGEKTPSNQLPTARLSEGKVKRGTGTEKQKLRERIREMLLNAGWTIDYRPRRNRDYLDAVYINPSGTAYWSIIKAYDALLKQIKEDEEDAKAGVAPLSDEVLSQLTRKTRKKIEKELKKKQRDAGESEKVREATLRKSFQTREVGENRDSSSHEEKLSSFIKSSKGRTNGSGSISANAKNQSSTHHLDESNERPAPASNSHHGRKSKKLGRCTLLIRNSNSGLNSENDGFVPYAGKRTLLSWLIDCGAVQLSQKVRYMNRRRTKVMLEGWVTREGIHCGCCSKILTVSKFEIHAGSKLRQPFQNIYLDSGISLLDCQIEAWSRQESEERIGFHSVDTDGDDPNDDTCGLCGDGGDLICCDGCPSTFHQSCLNIKMLPPGDWHCPNCTCKFCGLASGSTGQEDDTTGSMLPVCSLCAKKYHRSCTQEMDTCHIGANSSVPCFCGNICRELFEQLQRYLGIKHELDSGFTWSLIHRTDEDSETSLLGLPLRVECNSKLAVALSVMDECFLPIVDRRSRINLIRSVLYNCGSNFNRLNFSGFYTVVLERGDEIISAASIRFHGTQLAEMPFIGTRHMYRRQGMCRRLFEAIESAFKSMKVEKLIIPAISELTDTWTDIFGFTTLDELLKQKLKSMNMLVFPGIDMLQKQLVEQENVDRIKTSGGKLMESRGSENIKLKMENKHDATFSARHDHHECNNGDLELDSETKELATANSDSQCLDVSIHDASVIGSCLDAPHEHKTRHTDSESDDKLESTVDKNSLCTSVASHEAQEMHNKSESDFAIGNNCVSSVQGDPRSMDSILKSKSICMSDASRKVGEKDSEPEPNSLVKDIAESCIQGANVAVDSDVLLPGVLLNDASALNSSLDVSSELQDPVSLGGTPSTDSELGESASGEKLPCISNASCDRGDENKPELISPSKEDNQPIEKGVSYSVPALNLNVSVSDDLQEENKLGYKFDGQASNEKSLIKTDTSQEAMDMETKPLFDFPVEDNGQPCREAKSGGADSMDVDTMCLEAAPSREQTAIENSAKQIDENSSVSVTTVISANGSPSQIDSERTKTMQMREESN